MQTHTLAHTGLQGTEIVRDNEKLVILSFSACTERPQSAHEEALRLVYTEALLSGAGVYNREKFLDTLSLLGSSLSVSADAHYMHISLQAIDATHIKTLQLFQALFAQPHFEQKEIARIKGHLKNLLILSKEDAKARAYQEFNNAFTLQSSPHYMHSIDELLTGLTKITRRDLPALHAAFLATPWMYSTGGSRQSTADVTNIITKLRKSYPLKNTPATTYQSKSLSGRKITLLDIPNKHNIEFSIGGQIPLTRRSAEFPAFVFGMCVLALYGGFAGRLMSIVREKEGLTYSIYGQAERLSATHDGFWRIMTFFNPKDAVQGITSTLREITRMHTHGITKDEHKRFKSILRTRHTMVHDSLIKKVREVHTYSILGLSETEYATFKETLLNVTILEVNEAMKKFLDPKDIVISGAGPIQSVQKKLKDLGK